MINVDQQTARCMILLRNADEFRPIRKWLEQSLADVDRKLRRASPDTVGGLQGEARVIEAILERFDDAHEVDKRHDQSQRRGSR